MKTSLRLFTIALLVAFFPVVAVRAQTSVSPQTNIDSLSTLPDSEFIIYLNAQRIVNEALPRLLPEKENREMNSGIDQVKAFTNVDIRHLEFLVVSLRFNKPAGGVLYPLPEAMLVVRGDFDAQALIGMATSMSDGKLREEKYGSRSINVVKLDEMMKGASNNPFAKSFSELAIASLDPHTLAVGNSSYVKAALDAVDGRGRIKAETLASVFRDPNVLVGISGSPLLAFAKSFGLRLAQDGDPCRQCMTRFGEFYGSLNMDGQGFKLTGAMHADNPETAIIVRNMLSGILDQAKGSIPDKNAQAMFDAVKLVAEASEVLVQHSISHETATKYVREMLAPKPPPKPKPVVEKKEVAAPKAGTRRTRRRR